MTNPTYAGIGSRNTPDDVLMFIQRIARKMAIIGVHLQTGGADGADTAFQIGARKGPSTIYVPWNGYNNLHAGTYGDCEIKLPPNMAHSMQLASQYHPAWDRCSKGARMLHARNMNIILGDQLNTPVKGVICWTEQGLLKGGTAQGIRLAQAWNIPVINLGDPADLQGMETWLK